MQFYGGGPDALHSQCSTKYYKTIKELAHWGEIWVVLLYLERFKPNTRILYHRGVNNISHSVGRNCICIFDDLG